MADLTPFTTGFAGKAPTSFQVDSVTPTGVVDLSWDASDNDDVRGDYLITASSGTAIEDNITAQNGVYPEHISAHLRDMQGYKLHRDTTNVNFVPDGITQGSGNNIADEGTLMVAANSYQDTGLAPDTYYYKLARVTNLT